MKNDKLHEAEFKGNLPEPPPTSQLGLLNL